MAIAFFSDIIIESAIATGRPGEPSFLGYDSSGQHLIYSPGSCAFTWQFRVLEVGENGSVGDLVICALVVKIFTWSRVYKVSILILRIR